MLDRAEAAGAMRRDVEADDLSLVFAQLACIYLGQDERSRQLRLGYLGLLVRASLPWPLIASSATTRS